MSYFGPGRAITTGFAVIGSPIESYLFQARIPDHTFLLNSALLQSLNLTSPAHSTASNDLDYMDGSISGTSNNSTADSSPSKSAASASSNRASAGKKNAFMKTISGIFNRSSSLSSVARQGQPDVVAEASQAQQASVRFPRLNVGFNRSSSVHREANKKVGSPSEGKAPKAEISELGSLGSLASNSTTSTPLRRPANNHSALGVIGVGMAAGSMFQVRVIKFETSTLFLLLKLCLLLMI